MSLIIFGVLILVVCEASESLKILRFLVWMVLRVFENLEFLSIS